MAIKVNFTNGAPTATASGLYQWDYGQTLEIECAELGSEIMEVHFACRSMSEAIVRSCSFSNGVGTVTIPDQCLEQADTITAWIYSISGTQGHTVKTITLPVTARTRPSVSRDVPMEYINLYGEALNEINEAINNLENGNITAAKATHANTANSANTATNAGSASYATSAGSASRCITADQSKKMVLGSPIVTLSVERYGDWYEVSPDVLSEGIYLVVLYLEHPDDAGNIYSRTFYSGVGYIGTPIDSEQYYYEIGLGEDMYIYIRGESKYHQNKKIIEIDIRTNKGISSEDTGTLSLYRIMDFTAE